MKIIGPSGPLDVTVAASARLIALDGGGYRLDPFEEIEYIEFVRDGGDVWVWWEGHSARFTLPDTHDGDTDHEALAPMTGKVVSIPVKIGDTVKRGDTVAILEAMKMEYKLEAEADGTVEEIGAKEGDLVDLGQLLVRLK